MRSRVFLISLFTTISLRTCHPLHIFLLFIGCSVVNSSSFSAASTRCLAAFLCICVSAHYSSTLILLLLHPANHAHHGAFWRPFINSLILHHSIEWAEVMPTRLRGFGMTTSPSIDLMTIMARLTLQYPLALTTGSQTGESYLSQTVNVCQVWSGPWGPPHKSIPLRHNHSRRRSPTVVLCRW